MSALTNNINSYRVSQGILDKTINPEIEEKNVAASDVNIVEDPAWKEKSKAILDEMIAKSADNAKRLQYQYIKDTLLPIVPNNPFFIEAKKIQELLDRTGLKKEDLLQKLIPIVKALARPPISNYHVSVAGMGKSGNVYLGVNLEFPGFPLHLTIHGEHFLITNARNHGETELDCIAISAAPCGGCRQFINEIGGEGVKNLKILLPDEDPILFPELLPKAFGPGDLGVEGGLISPLKDFKNSEEKDLLIAGAQDAANSKYAPYTKSFSGAVIQTKDGKIFSGSYLQNAAYNPSLSPFQTALVALVADMKGYNEIAEVVLVEKGAETISHADETRALMKKIAPDATLRIIDFETLGN